MSIDSGWRAVAVTPWENHVMLSGLTMDHGRFVAALWAIRDKRPLSGFVLFLLSILPKWQPLIIAPFLLAHTLEVSDIRSLRRALVNPVTWKLAIALLVTVSCVGAVFGDAPLGAFHWVLLHPFLSGDTLNIPWVTTFVARMRYRTRGHRTHSRDRPERHPGTDPCHDLALVVLPRMVSSSRENTCSVPFKRPRQAHLTIKALRAGGAVKR
jgi:hypothetical protein